MLDRLTPLTYLLRMPIKPALAAIAALRHAALLKD
jgi:hypothetical protein